MADFDESKHPRDDDGKFTDGNGSRWTTSKRDYSNVQGGEAQRVFDEAKQLGVDTKGIDNLDVIKAKVEEKKRLQSDSGSGKIKQRDGFIDIRLFGSIKDQTPKELAKTIKSEQKRIAEHKEKIQNPEKYSPNWDNEDKNIREGRIKYWQKEIANHTNMLDQAMKVLEEKKDDNS